MSTTDLDGWGRDPLSKKYLSEVLTGRVLVLTIGLAEWEPKISKSLNNQRNRLKNKQPIKQWHMPLWHWVKYRKKHLIHDKSPFGMSFQITHRGFNWQTEENTLSKLSSDWHNVKGPPQVWNVQLGWCASHHVHTFYNQMEERTAQNPICSQKAAQCATKIIVILRMSPYR